MFIWWCHEGTDAAVASEHNLAASQGDMQETSTGLKDEEQHENDSAAITVDDSTHEIEEGEIVESEHVIRLNLTS